MRSPITALLDAADTPGLRLQVTELQNELQATRLELAQVKRDLKSEQKRADFYFGYFCEEAAIKRSTGLRIAEDAWGLAGGG